jgi:hypothetical protein
MNADDISRLVNSPEWKEDCQRWQGRPLVGKFSHWCYDWDELPIDETTYEFSCCNCFDSCACDICKNELASNKQACRDLFDLDAEDASK